MIMMHGNRSPNSQKVTLLLEEADIEYGVTEYDIGAGDLLTAEFGKINPNRRIPAIVDFDPVDGGGPLTVFESGAILLYLADKVGRFLPDDPRGRAQVTQWLVWQVAGLGPMMGQAGHFLRYAPEGEDYGINRYSKESMRLLNVMESQLRKSDYLAGEYSIADMACWPWINAAPMATEGFPAIDAWKARLETRQAYSTVISGSAAIPQEMLLARMKLTPEQWSNLFGERLWASTSADSNGEAGRRKETAGA